MRTTLTLDDDVAKILQRVVEQRKSSFKSVVNDALREGLRLMTAPRKRRKRFQTRGVSLGRCLVGSIDNVADALAAGEGEDYR